MSGDSALAVASLDVGAVTRDTTIATTKSRQRLPAGPRIRSRPIRLSVPSTAATWPCGSARRMVNAPGPAGTAVPPLSKVLNPSTKSFGQPLRLQSVRFLTLPPSR